MAYPFEHSVKFCNTKSEKLRLWEKTRSYFSKVFIKKRAAPPQHTTFQFEPLEPRILLSADLSFGAANDELTLRLVEDQGQDVFQLIDTDSHVITSANRDSSDNLVNISGSVAGNLLNLDDSLIDAGITLNFSGGDGDDSVAGFGLDNNWRITGSESSTLNNNFFFSDVESLIGGSLEDTLFGSKHDTIWNITGSDSGKVDGLNFFGFESLTGAADNQDTFVFDSGGLLSGLVEGGDGGFDTLEITGGEYQTVVFAASGPDSGMVLLDGSAIEYAGFEPITLDASVTNIAIDFSLLTLESDDNAALTRSGDTFTFASSDVTATFEQVTFDTGFESLLIDLGTGTDTLNIEADVSMSGNFSAIAESITIADTASITSTAGDINISAVSNVDTDLTAAIVVESDLDAAGDINIEASVDISDSLTELGDYAYTASATVDVSATSISAGDAVSIGANVLGLYDVEVTSTTALDDGSASITGTHSVRTAVAGGVSVTAGGNVNVVANDTSTVQTKLVPASDETGLGTFLDFSDVSSAINLTRDVTASIGDSTNGMASIGGLGGTAAGITSVTARIADHATNGGIAGIINSDIYGQHITTAADTVVASVTDATVQVDSLAVSASNSTSYIATAKGVDNTITGGTTAIITDSTVTATSLAGVSVSASDTAFLTATSSDFELDRSLLTVPLELGSSTAVNDIVRSVSAMIAGESNIDVSVGGVSVDARSAITVVANTDAQILDDAGISIDPVELSLNGTLATNIVGGDVTASITDSTVEADGDVEVTANNDAIITATAMSGSDTSGAATLAATGAFAWNAIGIEIENPTGATVGEGFGDVVVGSDQLVVSNGGNTSAFIADSNVDAGGNVRVEADSSPQINATVSNAAESTADALFGAGGIAGIAISGVVAANRIDTQAHAYIETDKAIAIQNTVDAGGNLTVSANDSVGVFSNVKMVSSSITSSDGSANLLGATIASFEDFDYRTDGTNSEDANGNGIIDVLLEFGQKVSLSTFFNGVGGSAGRVYEFLGSNRTLTLADQDYSDLDLWREILETDLIPQGNNFLPSNSLSYGGILVRNEVSSDAQARLTNVDVSTTDGNIAVTATVSAEIMATADATGTSSGGNIFGKGTSTAASGIVSTNVVLSTATATIENSIVDAGGVLADGDVTVNASNTSSIDASNHSAITTGSESLGVILAYNTLGYQSQDVLSLGVDALIDEFGDADPATVAATIADSKVTADGDVDVTATNDAKINALTDTAATSSAAALFGADGINTSLVLASNLLATETEARVDGVDLTVAGTVNVAGMDSAIIDATTMMVPTATETNELNFGIIDDGITTILNEYQFTTESGTALMEFGDQVRIAKNIGDVDDADALETGAVFRYMGPSGTAETLIPGTASSTDFTDFGLWQELNEFNALGGAGEALRKGLGLSSGTAKNRFGLIARNDIDARVEAVIDDSTLVAGSHISVTATEAARITALENSVITADSNTAKSGSKGGIIANNQVLSRARAYVTDSDLTTTENLLGDVIVEAFNLSVLDAKSLTEVTGARSVSIVAAFNSAGWDAANIFFNAFDTLLGTDILIEKQPLEASAFIENSNVVADGDVSVTASTSDQLFSLSADFAQLLDDLSIQDLVDSDNFDADQDADFLVSLKAEFDSFGYGLSNDVNVTLLAVASEWLIDDREGSVYVVRRDGDDLNVSLTSILDVQVGNEVDSNVVNDSVLVDLFKSPDSVVKNKAGTITDLKYGASGMAAGGVFSSNRASAMVEAYIDTGADFSSSDTVGEMEKGDRVELDDGSVYKYIGDDRQVDSDFTYLSLTEPSSIQPAIAETDDAAASDADRVKLSADTTFASAGEIYEYIGTVALTTDFSFYTADHQSDITPEVLKRGDLVELASDVNGSTAGEFYRYTGDTQSNLFDFTTLQAPDSLATGERVFLTSAVGNGNADEIYEYLGDGIDETVVFASQDFSDTDLWGRVDFDLASQDYTTIDWELVGIDLTAIDYTDSTLWQLTNAPLVIDLSNTIQNYANNSNWSLVDSGPSVSVTAGGTVSVSANDALTLIADSQLDISSAVTNNIDAVFNLIDQIAIPSEYIYTTKSGEQTVVDGDTVRVGLDLNGDTSNSLVGVVFRYSAGDDPLPDLTVDLGTLTQQDFEDSNGPWVRLTGNVVEESGVADFFPNIGNLSDSDSRAVGGIIVFNNLSTKSVANINEATITAGSDVTVQALENATLLAILASNVSSSGGSAFGTGESIAVNGVIASNVVLSQADASITSSNVDNGGSVSVEAHNTSRMDATTNSQTATGDTSVSIVAAFNTIGWQAQNILSSAAEAYTSGDPLVDFLFEGSETAKVSAYITDSDVEADGDVRVSAESTALINATTTNVNESAASALINAGGNAIGALISTNKVNSAAEAYIDNTNAATNASIDAAGDVSVTSADNAGIFANNRLDTQSSSSNDGGVSVLQETLNDLIPADWVANDDPQLVNLRFRDLVRLDNGFTGDGDAGSLYVYLGEDVSSVDLSQEDYSDLDFWKPQFFTSIFPAGNNISDSDSIGAGSLVVLNDLRSDVDAYIETAKVNAADGNVTVVATESATLRATVDSAVSSSGGSALGAGTSIAGNSSIASNILLSDADAYVANSTITATDSTATNLGNVSVIASNASEVEAINTSITNSGDTAIGVVLAFNTVGWEPSNILFQSLEALIGDPVISSALNRELPASASAYIDNSKVIAEGTLTVEANTTAVIIAQTSNETSSAASAFVNASGMAIGGVVTSSKVSSATEAYISDSSVVDAGGNVIVGAMDAARVIADNTMIATSETVNSGGVNLLTNFLDQLAGEYNFTSNSGTRDISEGDRVRVASDFSGTGVVSTDNESSIYLYLGDDAEFDLGSPLMDYTAKDWVRFDVDDITSYIPDQLNFNVSSSNSIGIGGLIAFNDVRAEVDANISSSTIDAGGDVLVTASEEASIIAANVSEAEADGGSVFTSGLSLAISGTVVTNQVFSNADANITDSTLGSAVTPISGEVTVRAVNDASITATTDSALTVFGGGTSIAIGATLAFNRIGVQSYLLDGLDNLFDTSNSDIVGVPVEASAQILRSDVYAGEGVSVLSSNDATVSSTIANAAFASSVSLGSGNDTVVSISPVIAFNRMATATTALIDDSNTIITELGDIEIVALDESSVDASITVTSVSLALGTNQSVGVSVGFSFALNEIENAVNAIIRNSDDVMATQGSVRLSASQDANILSTGVSASVAASAGTGSTFGFSAAGAFALNEILGGANASIEGSTVMAGDSGADATAGNVEVIANNNSIIDAFIASASAAVSFGVGADAVAGSIGAAFADNRIGYSYNDNRNDSGEEGEQAALDVQAFLLNSEVSADSDIIVDASSTAFIDATIIAASAALAASTSNALSLSAAGAITNNQIATRVRAFINGDGDPVSGAGVKARSITVSAEDASAITTVVGAASISGSIGLGGVGGSVSVGAAIALNEIDNDTQAFIINADDGVTTATTFTSGSGTQIVTIGNTVKLAEDADISQGEAGAVYEYTGSGDTLDLGVVDFSGSDWQLVSGDVSISAQSGNDPLFQFALTDFSVDELNNAAMQNPDDFSTDNVDEALDDALDDADVLSRLIAAFDDEGISLKGSPDATSRDVTIYSTGKGNDWALVDRLGLNFNIHLNPLTGELDVSGTSISSVAAAASVAVGLSSSTGAGFSGAGAFSDNVILGTTNAYIKDSLVTAVGDVDLDAANTSVISAIIASASIGVGAGASNGVGASLGVALARNFIGSTVDGTSDPQQVWVYVQDSSLVVGGDLILNAYTQQSITSIVLSGSMALSAGSAGSGSLSGAGVGAENVIAVDTESFINGDGTAGIVASGLSLNAEDASQIIVYAGAASVAGSADLTGSASLSLGLSIATNTITSETLAYVLNADTGVQSTLGDIVISAVSSAGIQATSAALSIGGSAGVYAGVSLSGAGAVANNVILTKTNGYIQDSVVISAAEVNINASNSSNIDALILAFSASVGAGAVGATGSIGVAIAENLIGFEDDDTVLPIEVQAYIEDASIMAAGALTLTADSTQSIDATVFSGAVGIALGGSAGSLNGAGSDAVNRIATNIVAQINGDGESGIVSNNIELSATDAASISALVGAASVGFAVSPGASVTLNIGVALAENEIRNVVDASIINADTGVSTTAADIVLTAQQSSSINSTTAAASLGVSVGLSGFSVSLNGAGADATNVILTITNAYIQDSNISSDGRIDLGATSDSDIDAIVAAFAGSLSVGGTAIGGAIGVSLAQNLIGYDRDGNLMPIEVQAYVQDTSIFAEGDMTLSALATQSIDATVVAGAVGLAAGGGAAAVSGAGADALNRIASSVTATIIGDGNDGIDVNGLSLSAIDDSQITAFAGAASVSVALSFTLSGSFALGVSLAENEVNNTITASIVDADTSVSTRVSDIELIAMESTIINSTSAAAAIGASAGVASLSISGAGAHSENVIDNVTQAFIEGSVIDSSDDVIVTADATSVIDALVISASAALGGGVFAGAVSIGRSEAVNEIGSSEGASQILAYVTGSEVLSDADLTISANAGAQINADVASFAVSLSAGAVSFSASNTGAEASNVINTDVEAFVGNNEANDESFDTTIDVKGNVDISADDISAADANVGSASLAASSGGVSGSVSIASSVADNFIDNEVFAYTTDAIIVTAGNVNITASESAGSVAKARTASVSSSFLLSISGGSAIANDGAADSTITRAYVGEFSDITADGNLTVEATGKSVVVADAGTSSSASGILSVAEGGAEANATVAADVIAFIGQEFIGSVLAAGATRVETGGDVSVLVNAGVEGDAKSKASSSGTVAIGGAGAIVDVDADIQSYIDRNTTIIAGGAVTVDATLAGLTDADNIDDTFQFDDVDLDNDTIVFDFPLETGDRVQFGLNGNLPFLSHILETDRDYAVLVDDAQPNTIKFGAQFTGSTVDGTTDTIVFDNPHGFETGDLVRYDPGTGTSIFADSTLDTLAQFQVIVVDTTTIKLAQIGASTDPVPSTFTVDDVDPDTGRITITGSNQTFADGTAVTYREPVEAEFASTLVDVNITGSDEIDVDDDGNIVTTDNNRIFIEAHGFEDGDQVLYLSDGDNIAGLTSGMTYFVIRTSANSIQLAVDEDGANNDEDINISTNDDTGSRHTLRKVSDGPIGVDTSGTLVDGVTYYVFNFDSNENSFQLTETVDGTNAIDLTIDDVQTGSSGLHSLTTEALDLVESGDTSVQDIYLDLEVISAAIFPYKLLGAGGSSLADVSPPSGDGTSSSSASGGGGGAGSFQFPASETTLDITVLAWIAADLEDTGTAVTGIEAAGDVSINATSEGTATSTVSNSSGGVIKIAEIDATTTYNNDTRAYVGKSSFSNGSNIDADGVQIISGGLFEINTDSDNTARSNATADGGGLIGFSDAEADTTINGITDSRVGANANIQAESVRITANSGGSDAQAKARAKTIAFAAISLADANVINNSVVEVGLEGGSNEGTLIRAEQGADFIVNKTGYSSDENAKQTCICVFFPVDSTDSESSSGTDTTEINAATGVTVTVGARQNGTPLVTNADLPQLALYVDAESGSNTATTTWNSDVIFLRGPNPELLVDDTGNIVIQENIEATVNAFSVVVEEITPSDDELGQALFTGDGVLTGEQGTFFFRQSYETVTITNESDLFLSIQNITVYNDGLAERDVEDVRLDVPTVDNFGFDIVQDFAETLVEISTVGGGDLEGDPEEAAVVLSLEGTIDNPIGTTSITTTTGSAAQLIGVTRTNILELDINGNTTAESFSDLGPLNIELVRSEDRPTGMIADIAGNAELIIRGLLRDDTVSAFEVNIDEIVAGGNVILTLHEGKDQTNPADPDPDFKIEVFETSTVTSPDGGGERETEWSIHFRPDESPFVAELPLGVFGNGETLIETTYNFGLIEAGRDIDVFEEDTGSALVNITAVTNNVTHTTDLTIGNVDVTTDGNITLTESDDDLRVGLISTLGDVSLTAIDGSIIDAPDDNDGTDLDSGDTAADVIGDNFVFSASGGGIGSELNVLEIDSATDTDGTLTANAFDDIFITKIGGNMNIDVVVSESNVTLVTDDGDILDAADSSHNNDQVTDVQGGEITLISSAGSIGTIFVDTEALRTVETNLIVPSRFAADLNTDGTVNTFDITAFQNAFISNDPIADLNGDGTVNTLDITAFQVAFVNLTATEGTSSLVARASSSFFLTETEGTLYVNEITSTGGQVFVVVLDDASDDNDLVVAVDGVAGSISANFGVILEVGDDFELPEGASIEAGTSVTISVDDEDSDPDAAGGTVLVLGTFNDNVGLILRGGVGEDVFDITLNDPVAFAFVSGGEPELPADPGDTFIVRSDSSGTDSPSPSVEGSGTVSISGIGDISYTGIETIILDTATTTTTTTSSLPLPQAQTTLDGATDDQEQILFFDSSSGELMPLGSTDRTKAERAKVQKGENARVGDDRNDWIVLDGDSTLDVRRKGLIRW